MAKMWAGRFSKPLDEAVNSFNASILFDQRMADEDIQGSLAHSEMLMKQGILTPDEKEAIHAGLHEILDEIHNGTLILDERYEDIHMAVEQVLTEKIGDAGKKLHTARSRNDQVALDLRLYTRKELKAVRKALLNLIKELVALAKANTETIMPGYTHLQRAQPVTFGHVMMAYANMFKRDVKRISNTLELMNESPLGCAALAGTTWDIDRHLTAQLLEFDGPCDNSLDGVSDRDYVLETESDLSIIMVHLSRLSEEIIFWCSWEFKFIELDDAFATGSSIMPQKKNPDIPELCRGKTGRVFGDLMQGLTMMKSLPLAYNKDMQEDKESLFDALDSTQACLTMMSGMLKTVRTLPANMEAAAHKGFINATDLADYLTSIGYPFRDAYKISGELVAYCIEHGLTLSELDLDIIQAKAPKAGPEVKDAISLSACLNRRKSFGGPAPEEVNRQIAVMEEFIEKEEHNG